MASFQQHITFSSLLGAGYGAAAYLGLEFTPVQAALAGCLTAVGGMLPDLDAPTGRPGREIFGLTAAVAPLVLIGRVLHWTGLPNDPETIMLLLVGMYFAVRYGAALIVHRLSTHRGMFHSIPAMLISGELVYLGYPGDTIPIKLLMAGGVTLGFFSHLFLDEVYSVDFKQGLPSLKKSSGTAIKMYGPAFAPNVVTYALFGALSYAVLVDADLIKEPDAPHTQTADARPVEATPELNRIDEHTDLGPGMTLSESPPAPPTEWVDPGVSSNAPLFNPIPQPPVNTAELDAPLFQPVVPEPGLLQNSQQPATPILR
jgi:hypothetical protein